MRRWYMPSSCATNASADPPEVAQRQIALVELAVLEPLLR